MRTMSMSVSASNAQCRGDAKHSTAVIGRGAHAFVVPPPFWHEHANLGSQPALLFPFHDFPLMKSLDLYREKAFPYGHQAA